LLAAPPGIVAWAHVVGEVVTPEIQAAADWMESLQADRQATDEAEASVTSLLSRTAAS
jgi:hypothetical protein